MGASQVEFHFTHAQVEQEFTILQSTMLPPDPESTFPLLDPSELSDAKKIQLIVLARLEAMGEQYANLTALRISNEGMGYIAVLTRAQDVRT